jgi:hypothetical protein
MIMVPKTVRCVSSSAYKSRTSAPSAADADADVGRVGDEAIDNGDDDDAIDDGNDELATTTRLMKCVKMCQCKS